MEALKKIVILLMVLAAVVGLIYMMFSVNNVAQGFMAFFLAIIVDILIVGLIGVILYPLENAIWGGQGGSFVSGYILAILFVVGMFILTPWFYNNVTL